MRNDPTGAAAPSGGFQNGGWYGGYQYFNGSFAPQAGMIHPQSPQQGAGQMVSSAVNQQSDAAQGLKPGTIDNYVAQQNNTQPQGGAGGGGGMPGDGGAAGGGMGAGGIGATAPAPLDLPGLYNSLSQSAGITDMEKALTDKQTAYNDAQSKINDNPFLSESSRVGRVQKLTNDYNNDIKTTQDSLAMKKADIQTQIDLQTKQFDINSTYAKQGLDTFNSLLQSGALDNASGQDIANITRSTGLSSQAIMSAVKAQQDKNQPTSVIQFDDGTNQGFAVINSKTGQVINKQVVAGSKILGQTQDTAAYKTSSTKTTKVTAADNKAQALQALPDAFKNHKMTLGTAMSFFGSYGLTPQQIYNQYKVNGQYKPTPQQVKADQKKYNVK